MDRPQILEKLDRIALYLTEQRVDLGKLLDIGRLKISAQQWEAVQEAIGIIEAARKRL